MRSATLNREKAALPKIRHFQINNGSGVPRLFRVSGPSGYVPLVGHKHLPERNDTMKVLNYQLKQFAIKIVMAATVHNRRGDTF